MIPFPEPATRIPGTKRSVCSCGIRPHTTERDSPTRCLVCGKPLRWRLEEPEREMPLF